MYLTQYHRFVSKHQHLWALVSYYMFKVPSFGMNTCPETFVPLIHCIIDYTLSLAMPYFCRTQL